MKKYEEVAGNVLKRRDEYVAKQKKEKKIVISTVVSTVCSCIICVIGCTLWDWQVFVKNTPIAGNSSTHSNDVNSEEKQNSNTDNTPSTDNSYSKDTYSSNPSYFEESNSQDEYSYNSDYSESKENTPSYNSPSINAVTYFIDSLDKINFYSAKKIINENSPFITGTRSNVFSEPRVSLLNIYVEYPIDREKVFTTTMVTYFTIKLYDEKGFLAQKLGGIGRVEVVITKNNIDDMGQMITFKRDENYYSCLLGGESFDPDSDKSVSEFSSHKYISGFNVVKNKNQENYVFNVFYEGSRVVGFECEPFQSTPKDYIADKVALLEENNVVLLTKQNFTIDQLEAYYKNENTKDLA